MKVSQRRHPRATRDNLPENLLLLLAGEVGRVLDCAEVLLQEVEAALENVHPVGTRAILLLELIREIPIVRVQGLRQANRRALRHLHALARSLCCHAGLLEVRGLGRQDVRDQDGALNLGALDDLLLVALQGGLGDEEEGQLAIAVELHRVLLCRHILTVAAHAPREALDEGIGLGALRTLPHERDVLLGDDLARTEAAANYDESGHLGGDLQARDIASLLLLDGLLLTLGDGHVGLGSGVVENAPAQGPSQLLHSDLLRVAVDLATRREAEERILLLALLEEGREAVGLARDVEGALEQARVEVTVNAHILRPRDELLHVLGVGRLLVLEGRQLRVGRGVHRDNEGVLLVERGGVAVHAEPVAGQEHVQLLALRLVEVRLVNDDESVGHVNCRRGKVLAEEHLNETALKGRGVVLLRVLNGLAAEL